jgi:hypothetical protein
MNKNGQHKAMSAIELVDILARLDERFTTLKGSVSVVQGLASNELFGDTGEYWASAVDKHIAAIDELLEVVR